MAVQTGVINMATFLTKGVDDRRIKEAYVKDRVKRWLNSIGAYQFWPVQSGLGAQGIPDCIFCWNGFFGSIETKRPGRRGHADRGCSKLQIAQGRAIVKAQGYWAVVDGPADLNELRLKMNV
ncbi:MAG: hypothetical protein RQ751_14770, partial [Longimicrobiales bacterium]|nr:hypothetical protein [Longimicrobiales bacterium]